MTDYMCEENAPNKCLNIERYKQLVKKVIQKYIVFVDSNNYDGVSQELKCDEFELKDLFKELEIE